MEPRRFGAKLKVLPDLCEGSFPRPRVGLVDVPCIPLRLILFLDTCFTRPDHAGHASNSRAPVWATGHGRAHLALGPGRKRPEQCQIRNVRASTISRGLFAPALRGSLPRADLLISIVFCRIVSCVSGLFSPAPRCHSRPRGRGRRGAGLLILTTWSVSAT